MEQNIKQAFKNTIIAFKFMSYSYSLVDFFKDEFKKDNGYLIPFSYILDFKKGVFPLIRDSCGYVCHNTKPCDGHNFLDVLEKIYQFEQNVVLERKCYFRDFYFFDFRFKRDEVHEMEKVCGFDFLPEVSKDLSHLTYLIRCQYLD